MITPDEKELIPGDEDLGIENLPSEEEKTKEAPDEETPSLIGQHPDVFNASLDKKTESIEHPAKQDDLVDDKPKPQDGFIP